ncbi:MAG: hypothetical protein V1860_00120 [bacterium]
MKCESFMTPPLIEKICSKGESKVLIEIPISELGEKFPFSINASIVSLEGVGRSMAEFCTLEKPQITLTEAGVSKNILLTVEIPPNMHIGSYHTILHLESPGNISQKRDILILLTFPGGIRKPEMALQQDPNSLSEFKITLRNHGEEYYTAQGGNIIFRKTNGQIGETVSLGNIDLRSFPKRERVVNAQIPKLPVGNYKVEAGVDIFWPDKERTAQRIIATAPVDFVFTEQLSQKLFHEVVPPLMVDKTEVVIEAWGGNHEKFSLQIKNSGSEGIRDLKITKPEWIKLEMELPDNLKSGGIITIPFSFTADKPGKGEIIFTSNLRKTSTKVEVKIKERRK